MDRPRLDAARAVGELIKKRQDLFAANAHRPGSTLVVCLESDTVPNVMARIVREVPNPPATLAVYWPETGVLKMISLKPASAEVSDTPRVARTTSIGMLVDGLGDSKGPFAFKMDAGFEVASSVSVYASA